MKAIRVSILLLLVSLLVPGMWRPAAAAYNTWDHVLTSLKWNFQPNINEYRFSLTSQLFQVRSGGSPRRTTKALLKTHKYDIFAVYNKRHFKFFVSVKRTIVKAQGPSGHDSADCFVTGVMHDPILYNQKAKCDSLQRKGGPYYYIPIVDHAPTGDICTIGKTIPLATREALRKEFEALIAGHPTVAPLPHSPKENSIQPNPDHVYLNAVLPLAVYTPCWKWNFTWLIERHAPEQGGYKWKPAASPVMSGFLNPDTSQCYSQIHVKLSPGKYRYKIQAQHADGRITPWSLPFEFEVAQKKIKVADPAKVAEAMDPWIKVTKPNGGESWKHGQKYYIRWNSFKVLGKVDIFLVIPGENSKRITPEGGVRASLGTWPWTPDQGIAVGKDYRIAVRSREDDPVYDSSDEPFAVAMYLHAGNQGKKLTLKEPLGGERWRATLPYIIRWSREKIKQGARVKVVLLKDGQFFKRISPAAGTMVTHGKTTWTPGADIPWSTKYQIKISIKGSPDIMDRSENFTIMPWVGAKKTGSQYGASVHTSSVKSKALLPAIKTAPVLKIKLNGRSFSLPARIAPSVKFASGAKFAYFEVQKSTSQGRWARAVVYKTKKFTISKPGTYRYRAVGTGRVKSPWDTFNVKLRPGATRNL